MTASMLPWLEQRARRRSSAATAGSTATGAFAWGKTCSLRGAQLCSPPVARALIPPIPGLAEAHPWTNVEATTAKEAPGRLAILGGGVVGVEMAQAWSALGSRVTLVHRGGRP